jgi:hypothetical protein
LNSTEYKFFHLVLKQFWGFIKSYPIFTGIVEDLERRQPQAKKEARMAIGGKQQIGETELENSALAYFMLKECSEMDASNISAEAEIGYNYNPSNGGLDGGLDVFKSLFLEPFYEYLDEQLDDQRAILYLLRKYKHRCEWFHRERLYKIWDDEKTKGEKLLTLDLYEYLHDQGLDFSIEPWSISGKPDLVMAQKGEDRLIADAKIFNASSKKKYIASGFTQVYRYTRTYNEPFGYLIVFNTSKNELKVVFPNQEQSTPFTVLNGKTIFMQTIDIYPIEETASKEKKIKTVEFTEDYLKKAVEEEIDSESQIKGDT